jgi:serine/threonine-protein kinase
MRELGESFVGESGLSCVARAMGSTGPLADSPLAASAATWTCPACHNVYPSEFTVCPRDATPRAESRAPAADPLIGEVLGRSYRITRVLGEGGMARLYEAEHLRIDARYAVKVIHDDLSRDPDLLARFEREARAAARIHSEHVVRLVDVLRTQDNRPCIVTELLEGEDLQALLDRVGKLGVADAVPIARQICRAMAAAHAVGVVHRDLKPANVFLCGPPGDIVVKVVDFGVAKLDDDEALTRSDAVMGTAAYMAPEQARSAADAGPLADVYSTSAVLYHMLTGVPPYGSVPAVSRLALVLHEEPARPRKLEPGIPDGVEAVVQHAMARDRASRVQSALELEAQLAAFDRSPGSAAGAVPGAAGATGATGASGSGTGSVGSMALRALDRSAATAATGDAIASQIAVRARLARPLAVFIAAASSLAGGAWIAAVLAVSVAPPSPSERALIAVMAVAAAAGLALVQGRALRRSWQSGPAVFRHIQAPARALVAGCLAFGALELVAIATTALFSAPPLGAGARIGLAGLAAGLGLAWQVLRLDDRLRHWIG